MGPLKRSPAESWPPYLQALHDSLLPRDRANDCPRNAGNNFLPGFVERFNERFAGRAAKPENLHRQMNVAPSRLSNILCHREQVRSSASTTIANKSSWNAARFRRTSAASMSSSTTSRTGRWRSDGEGCYFPTVSSVRISVSATPPSSRTNASAMR
jgi:hypothetical protein